MDDYHGPTIPTEYWDLENERDRLDEEIRRIEESLDALSPLKKRLEQVKKKLEDMADEVYRHDSYDPSAEPIPA